MLTVKGDEIWIEELDKDNVILFWETPDNIYQIELLKHDALELSKLLKTKSKNETDS